MLGVLKTWNTNLFLAKALYKIKKFQKSTDLLIPKLSFARLVKEIVVEAGFSNYIQANAILALQKCAKTKIIYEFERKYF